MVSIVIPLYNYSQYIKECLQSCQAPNGVDVEIVVIDDCSTDNSCEYLREYSLLYPCGFHWYTNSKNRGYSFCKNRGIIEAKGEYIVHLDADDMLVPHSVGVRLLEFENDPSLDMVHGLAERHRYGSPAGVNPKSSIHAQGVMIKRDVFKKFGLYYEGLRSMSDKEMWYRLGVHPESPLPRKIRDKKINTVVAYYRKHAMQMHKVRRSLPDVNKRIKKIFKNRIKELRHDGITAENTRFL